MFGQQSGWIDGQNGCVLFIGRIFSDRPFLVGVRQLQFSRKRLKSREHQRNADSVDPANRPVRRAAEQYWVVQSVDCSDWCTGRDEKQKGRKQN